MEPTPAETPAVLTKSVLNASRLLGLTDADLAHTLGLTAAEIARMAQGLGSLDPASREGRQALQLVQLCRALDALVGQDHQKLQAWMRGHNEALGATPQKRVQTSEGLAATLDYVARTGAAS